MFQQSITPIFVLGKGRRLRFVNRAWEELAGMNLADALGLVCSSRRQSAPLARALAPTPEALAGQADTIRRCSPTHRNGPPWWDVSFMPLIGVDGLMGLVGSIMVTGAAGAAASRKIPPEAVTLRDRHVGEFKLPLLASSSIASERLVSQVRCAAATLVPVWLLGEPGSGKETAARVIHHTSPQGDRAFIAIDCGGLQPYLIESLLFGHGGLIGTAKTGTLYLRDPAALPRDLQQRLIDLFLEAKLPAPRLICSSIKSSGEDARSRGLLPDFHATLSTLEIHILPLRGRMEDLPRFIAHFHDRLGVTANVEPAALAVLSAHAWPGNLRELAAVLAAASRAAVRQEQESIGRDGGTVGKSLTSGGGRATSGGTLRRDHLPRDLRERADARDLPPPHPKMKLDEILMTVESRLIQLALRKAGGNTTKASTQLGIWRARLIRRVEALKLGKPAGEA